MNNNIIYLTRYLKAFNKYLIITWAVCVILFAGYYFGLEGFIKKGPLMVLAEGEESVEESSAGQLSQEDENSDEYEEVGSVDLPPPEPIEQSSEQPPPEENVQEQTGDEQGSIDLPPSEPINEPPDKTIEDPGPTQETDEGGSIDLPPTEPTVDSSSPDVSIVNEPTPAQPERVVEREVVREVTKEEKKHKDKEKDQDDERRREEERERDRATSTPTPTPTATPAPSVSLSLTENICAQGRGNLMRFSFSSNSADIRTFYLDKNGQSVSSTAGNSPSIQIQINQGEAANFSARVQTGAGTFGGSNTVSVTGAVCASPSPSPFPSPSPSIIAQPSPSPSPVTTTMVGNQVVEGVIREIPAGALDNTCPYQVRAVITTTRTICDPQALQAARGQQVLAAVATPTPTPVVIAQTPNPSPRISPSPSVRVIVTQAPTPSPTPLIIVVQASPSPSASPQVQIITRNGSITIPNRQEIACPAGSRRIDQGSQIICEVIIQQGQTLAQVQTPSPPPQQIQKVIISDASPAATASAAPKIIAQVQTPATVLPNTGLPTAALGFGSLIPLGLGLRKWKGSADSRVSPNSLWLEKQLKD